MVTARSSSIRVIARRPSSWWWHFPRPPRPTWVRPSRRCRWLRSRLRGRWLEANPLPPTDPGLLPSPSDHAAARAACGSLAHS
jgi:hypothetical protein